MNETIEFLKKIKNVTRTPKEVTQILTELDYKTDESKKAFLDRLHQRNFINYNITGSLSDIYERTKTYNEIIGFKEEAKPLKFYAKIIEDGQSHLNKHLSEEGTKRHNFITRWFTGSAVVISLCSLIWTVYQGKLADLQTEKSQVRIDSLKSRLSMLESKRFETRIDSMQTKLSLLSSTVKVQTKQPSKGTALHKKQNKTIPPQTKPNSPVK